MIDWYTAFIAAVLILWAFSTPKDRNALRIVLIASLASEALVDFITRDIQGAWKLVVPGAVEVLTIMALLQWARTRTGTMQATLLLVAWGAHLLCYWDTQMKTDLVYSRYELIIQAVAAGQLAACHDTLFYIAGRVRNALERLGRFGVRGVPASSVSTPVLLSRRPPNA